MQFFLLFFFFYEVKFVSPTKLGYFLNLDFFITFKMVFRAFMVIFTRSGLSSETSNLSRPLSQMDMASLVSYPFYFVSFKFKTFFVLF